MKIRSSIVTSADVLHVIEEARDAELCRNLDLFRDILSVFWDNIESEPIFKDFGPGVCAELLRLCGVFLSQFGRARGFPDYQIRAKNILTRAVEMFEASNSAKKAAETKVGLATCYWYSGEVEEHDAMLRSVEAEFGAESDSPICIQIKLNRLLLANWNKNRKEVESLTNEVSQVIPTCRDLRLVMQFHNLIGIDCCLSGDLAKGSFHLKEAIRVAKEAKYKMFVAINLNNLANAYRMAGHLNPAQEMLDEAIETVKESV